MTRSVLFTALFAVLIIMNAQPSHASEASDPTEVAVTIYNGDLALVRENRDFNLSEGVQTLLLSDVSGKLNPATVHLAFPDGIKFSLLEQNYDYDLVSQDKLLEKFIGREVVIVDDEHDKTFKAKLLSVAGGRVVEDSEGRILLNPAGRVELPPGAADELLLKPTLSWQLWSGAGGRHNGEISYLSSGLDWHADYVVMLNADDSAGDIEGWVTISNYSGTTYKDAKLKLVAGDVNRVRNQAPPAAPKMLRSAEMAMPDEGFKEEEFFEYHLYDLQRPTTLKNSQLKQVGLLTAAEVPFKKIYSFNGINGGDTRVEVEFNNDEESGMGMPLPKGTVRVFKQDSEGDAQFVGEDRIDHTPRDEDVRLYLGNAFDIKCETVRTEYKDLKKGFEASYKVTLKNHKKAEDVVVTVDVNVHGDWKVLKSNYDYVEKSASKVVFNVPVKVDEEKELTFTYRVVWR